MPTEPMLAFRYAYTTLAADTAITDTAPVYADRDDAAGGDALYVIVESLVAGDDVTALENAGTRVWSEGEIQVTCVASNSQSYDAIDDLAVAVDADLHGIGGVTVTGGEIVQMFRARAPQHRIEYESQQYDAYVRQQYHWIARRTA